MPTMSLIARHVPLTQRVGAPEQVTFARGNLPVVPPLADPSLTQILCRRLACYTRFPPAPGAYEAILDTGAPVSIVPRHLWRDQFHWQEGRHFDVCEIDGVGPTLSGQLLSHAYPFRLVRLRVPMEVVGRTITERLAVEQLVVQLPDADTVKFVILGIWGGFFEGRRLEIDRHPNSDDLAANLVW